MRQGIFDYLWSGDLLKSFYQLTVRILTFLNIFFNRSCPVKKYGVTQHCFYQDSLTLSPPFLLLQSWKSEAELDYYQQKMNVRVAERLKI